MDLYIRREFLIVHDALHYTYNIAPDGLGESVLHFWQLINKVYYFGNIDSRIYNSIHEAVRTGKSLEPGNALAETKMSLDDILSWCKFHYGRC